MSPPRTIVMGGSLAGLAAGIFLRRVGCDVTVFERSRRPLQGRGAGIVLHPTIFRALDRDPAEITARAEVLRYLDRDGTLASEQPCDYRFISYSTLHRSMLEAFDAELLHLGSEVVDFTQDADTVEVVLRDGRRVRGDLLVCADGIRSTARRKLAPDVERTYAGYVGWRGTVVEHELSDDAFRTFADAITYCVLPDSHILVYPIPSPDGSLEPGTRLTNWVWYRNVVSADLDRLLVDTHGVRHDLSLGTGEVPEATVARLVADAARMLPPQLSELVAESREPFVQVVFDIAARQMAFGRIALIGDAACALRPHVAAGTAKAADDAWTLARAVSGAGDDLPGALREWETGRLGLAAQAMERARDAGVRAQLENSWRVGDPLPFGLYETGDSLLTQTT